MNDIIQKQKEEIENFLKSNEELKDLKVSYILVNQDTNETLILASDGYDKAIEFTPQTTKNDKFGYQDVPEWDYNFDYYIYNYLEADYRIAYMADDVHYGIWNSINELYPDEIEYKDGVQQYLQYCADNGITKKYLDEKMYLDTPDIMHHFEGLAFQEIMKYKGYVIEADDNNFDAPKENLVNIYENLEKYEAKETLETISLNTIGLKQNIKDYIDSSYPEKSNNDRESEKAYFTFVLGYDLLNDMLAKSSSPECDVSYDFCNMISNKFLDSEEYKNEKYSSYEMLDKWVNNNKHKITKEYEDFIGVENKRITFNNNKVGLEFGFRNDEKIALVENAKNGRTEYVVAINYYVENNNIQWGYGYYYNDYEKARDDFKKVISGGNLHHTFNGKDLVVMLIGHDEWDRPVYRDEKYNLYKDINMGQGEMCLCTAYHNEFEGEPYLNVDNDVNIKIVDTFKKNKNKDMER